MTVIQQVRDEAASERFATEAECQARCDELTAAIVAGREELCARQVAEGPHGETLLTSWNFTRYIPDVSVGGDYWRPRCVPGNR